MCTECPRRPPGRCSPSVTEAVWADLLWRIPTAHSDLLYVLTVILLVSYICCVFEVLADRHRRRILDLLRGGEQTVGDLVSDLGITQPGVSKHLRVLREAGLVEVRADAQRRLYRLRTEPLREIDEWLAPYRTAWRDRLDALEAHLDDMEE